MANNKNYDSALVEGDNNGHNTGHDYDDSNKNKSDDNNNDEKTGKP